VVEETARTAITHSFNAPGKCMYSPLWCSGVGVCEDYASL
jgi:hypothetical protein